ncbi:MAG TPA: hypothetical protein VE990_11410 [Acidimicrobiales bacterium]|nr:hypothetical protein [Acidimicrobiales bacterium]
MAAVLLRVGLREGLNSDAWWHLAAGQWMLSHHAVIRSDTFSYTVHGRPWVAEEWGFEFLLAWMVRTFGPVSFWLLSSGACIAALLVSVVRWRKLGARWLWVAVLAILAGGPLAIGEAPRPQSLSYLFFALELLVLTQARRNIRWLLCLPPLLLVWANVHGSFLAGLAVLGLELVLARWPFSKGRLVVSSPLPLRAAGVTFGVAVLSTLVNPHGPGLLSYAYHVSSSGQLSALITEWQSPDFHSAVLILLILVPAAAVLASLALSDARLEVFDLVLWGGLLLATLHAQRFIPYAAMAWGGLAARMPALRRETIKPSLLVWPIAALACFVFVAGPHPPAGAPERGGDSGMPVAATAYLQQHPGRVFSSYWYNDYLIHAGIPVFVDGRTDLYFGTPVLSEYEKLASVSQDPDILLNRWKVQYVLWTKGSALSVFLSHDHAWRQVFQAGSSVVFQRVQP